MNLSEKRYRHHDLVAFSQRLLNLAGLEQDKSKIVAQTLIDADLMGHYTHGIRLLPSYLQQLEKGSMTREGEMEIIADHGSAITWDGNYLPGPWLIHRAIDLALTRIKQFPVVTIVIRKSHHIACLATYPEKVSRQNLVMLLTSTDPDSRLVAPFGGITPVLGSNPLAAGIPAGDDPFIFDISTSEVAGGQIHKAFEEGSRLSSKSIISADGEQTDDPSAFVGNPGASIMPLGGASSGYKGTALGILAEALSGGLAGYGRKDLPSRWGASVFLQIIDPEAFGGALAFENEMSFLKEKCKSSTPRQQGAEIRLPGERALGLKREQIKSGIRYSSRLIDHLRSQLEKYNVSLPVNF